jgi:hypothetical protein
MRFDGEIAVRSIFHPVMFDDVFFEKVHLLEKAL